MLRKWTAWLLILVLVGTAVHPVDAQSQVILPNPGAMVAPSRSFVPVLFTGLRVYPKDPFRFDFIVDTGHASVDDATIKPEIEKIVRYFLASLTTPENEMWVNLSPYENTRIIPEALGRTEMGRDLLAQDYILKQLTSSLMYPEKDLGHEVWRRIYAAMYEQYGMTDVPLDTFNKVWIIPDEATVYVHGETAVIKSSHLKVMLEADYAAPGQQTSEMSHEPGQDFQGTAETRALAQKVLREIVIPVIEQEVNEGQNFAILRQITRAMVLAVWFKRNLSQSLVGRTYVDAQKVKGIDLAPAGSSERIWQQYVAAFKKGVFSYVKEEHDSNSQEIIPRKYFSGGFRGNAQGVRVVTADPAQMQVIMNDGVGRQLVAGVNLDVAQDTPLEKQERAWSDAGLGLEIAQQGLAEITGPAMLMAAGDAAMTSLVKEIFQLNGQVHNLDQADYEAGLQEMYEIFLTSQVHAGFYAEENLKGNEFVTFLDAERQTGFPEKFKDFLSKVRSSMHNIPEGRRKTDFAYGIAIWIMRYIDANAIYEVQHKEAGDVIHSLWHLVVGDQKSRTRKFLCDSYSILMLVLAEEMGVSPGVLTRVPVVLDDKGEYLLQSEEPNPFNLQGHVAVLFQFLDRTVILDQGSIDARHQKIQVINKDSGWETITPGNQGEGRGETLNDIKEYYELLFFIVQQSRLVSGLEKAEYSLDRDVQAEQLLAEVQKGQRSRVAARYNFFKVNFKVLLRRIEFLKLRFDRNEVELKAKQLLYKISDNKDEVLVWANEFLRLKQFLKAQKVLEEAEREFLLQQKDATGDVRKIIDDVLQEIRQRKAHVQALLSELNPGADWAEKAGGMQNSDNQLKGGIDLDPAAMTFTEMGNKINRFTSEPGQPTRQNITGFIPTLFSLTPLDPQTFFAASGSGS